MLVITDACRSGKLAGSASNGPQLTSANLSKQFANEVKILSCQPNEYSVEGEQWGGGRGAFSYHLVDGLYGMADKNKDQRVVLSEIDNYLEEHVTQEVAPLTQIPMTVGNKAELVSTVDEMSLAQLRQSRNFEVQQFSKIGGRGIVTRCWLAWTATSCRCTRLLSQRWRISYSLSLLALVRRICI
ncbi:MAG: hypothetical protein IPM82_23970 [Saprospiraceae bacterium]|nr:hypothetical protein [Saprospiraceae bacterium]